MLGHDGLPAWAERAALWSALLRDGQDPSAVQAAMGGLNDALFARITESLRAGHGRGRLGRAAGRASPCC